MTAVIPEGLEPLGVWDTRTVDNAWWYHWKTAVTWANRHIPRAGDTYRAEFYLIDAPFAVICRFKRDENGFKYQQDGEIATEPPVIVPLTELPPAHLLRG